MARLAQDPPAALVGVVDPMIIWQRASVYAIVHRKRATSLGKKRLHTLRHRSEPPIEADHQPAYSLIPRIRLPDRIEFLFGQTERLFAKHMLAAFERSQNLRRVQMMSRGDHDGADRRVGTNHCFVR